MQVTRKAVPFGFNSYLPLLLFIHSFVQLKQSAFWDRSHSLISAPSPELKWYFWRSSSTRGPQLSMIFLACPAVFGTIMSCFLSKIPPFSSAALLSAFVVGFFRGGWGWQPVLVSFPSTRLMFSQCFVLSHFLLFFHRFSLVFWISFTPKDPSVAFVSSLIFYFLSAWTAVPTACSSCYPLGISLSP